jgi:hypothetical protein
MLIPPPRLDEELWVCLRRRWRKGVVVAVKRKTLRLALLRPMPECPLLKEVSAGWAYVATEHELRRDLPTTGIAPEWASAAPDAPPMWGAAARRSASRPSRGSPLAVGVQPSGSGRLTAGSAVTGSPDRGSW